jgi:3-hydroxyacyl-CoA dehydrogenase
MKMEIEERMPVSIERDGPIAVVTVDNPPVNALSQAVRSGLLDVARRCADDPDIAAAVITCVGRTFIAGADIREFDAPPQEPFLGDVINAIEASPIPWVAALFGTALGGGLEVALGCHYRIALSSARMGLPEVTLGIIPGAGGTQRLPRLVGLDRAIEMITGGRPIAAAQAVEDGLVDQVVEGDLREAALSFVRGVIGKPPRRTGALPCPAPDDADYWARHDGRIAGKARGQLSPIKALDSLRLACSLPIAEGLKAEREIFLELKSSPQSRALRHAFFAERAVSKVPDIKGAEARPFDTVAVIGGGTMGSGITAALLDAGLSVTMVERDAEALDRGISNLRKIYLSSVRKGRMSDAEMERRIAMVTPTTDYAALDGTALAIEAAFEDMEVKREIFRRLDETMPQDAVLATNTSYLDIDEIAAATSRPSSVLGLHFFSPAHVMKLLEVVRARHTAPDVLATGFALAKILRKVGVLAGVCDGFIGNRILKVYRRQADFLLEDGCLPREVDAAMRAFGFPMGPYEAQDLGGLDIAWANRKRQAATRDPGERYVRVADRLCEAGRFGQKSGAGWYRYEPGDRTPCPDPEVERVILEESERKGILRREFTEAEIQRYILWAMINEGAKILEEGIACRPLDIDMVEIHGYGFPRWRGGLMFYADEVGVPAILDGIRGFAAAESDTRLWQPAELLVRLAAEGRDFASLNGS